MTRLLILPATLCVLVACSPAAGDDGVAVPGANPVVVELYTSQGCSSCPPADKVLRELAFDEELSGVVIPLSFHVDYWNYLGWSDPFSSRLWSERQGRYARALGVNVYTPQAVVGGRVAMVGSRERDVRRAILEESRREPRVRILIESLTMSDRQLTVSLTSSSSDVELWLVVWESGLVTPVPRGENRGRKLENDHVVRWLQRVEIDATKRGRVEVDLAPGWNLEQLGTAAFAQDPKTMEIVGAVVR